MYCQGRRALVITPAARGVLWLRMSSSENREPSRIKSGTGIFRDMRLNPV